MLSDASGGNAGRFYEECAAVGSGEVVTFLAPGGKSIHSCVLLTYDTYIYGTGQRSYKGAYYMDFALRKVAQLEVEAIN